MAVAFLGSGLLDPQYGLVTYLLRLVGLPPVNWLGDHRIALWSLVLVTVWKTVGYPLVIYLAGLQAIPGDLLEAAALDGANAAEAPYLAPPHPDEPVPPDHAHRHELWGSTSSGS